jgi:hypothetical protein
MINPPPKHSLHLPSTFPVPLQTSHSTKALPEVIFPLPLHSSQLTGTDPLPEHFAQATSPSPLQALQINNLISVRQNGRRLYVPNK